jgi:glycosyltransferase involved in cell wall biosynthesis
MNQSPLITIALPVYNGARTLSVAIESIIAQTYTDWELLVLDDGSIDATASIAQQFEDDRVKYMSDGKNLGIATRLNQAIAIGKGQYFCRMDADDISFSHRLEIQLAFLRRNPDVDLVASSVVVFRDDGSLEGVVNVQHRHEDIVAKPLSGFYFPHPTWMGRMDWFKKNMYSALASGAEDQLLLYSTYKTSRFAGIEEVLLGYRENGRTFRKMLSRRITFLFAFAKHAAEQKKFGALLSLCAIQSLKVISDFLNIKLGFPWSRNKLSAVSPELLTKWSAIRRARF